MFLAIKIVCTFFQFFLRFLATTKICAFFIAEDGVQDTEEPEEQTREENETTTPFGMNYHPTLPDGDVFTGVAGISHMRDVLLELIHE